MRAQWRKKASADELLAAAAFDAVAPNCGMSAPKDVRPGSVSFSDELQALQSRQVYFKRRLKAAGQRMKELRGAWCESFAGTQDLTGLVRDLLNMSLRRREAEA